MQLCVFYVAQNSSRDETSHFTVDSACLDLLLSNTRVKKYVTIFHICVCFVQFIDLSILVFKADIPLCRLYIM